MPSTLTPTPLHTKLVRALVNASQALIRPPPMLLLTLACLPCPPRTHTLFPLTGRWKSAYARVKMANRMKTGKLSMLNVRTSKGQSVAARLDRIESSMGGLDRIVIEVRQKQAASDVRAAQFELTVNARFDSVPSMQTIVGTIRTEIAEVSREHGTHTTS